MNVLQFNEQDSGRKGANDAKNWEAYRGNLVVGSQYLMQGQMRCIIVKFTANVPCLFNIK
jgi:hypothetical protein